MKFAFYNFIIALGLTCLTTVALGLFVYFRDRTKKLNQVFGLYSLSIAIWSAGQIRAITAPSVNSALVATRLSQVGVNFIPTLFYHFVLCLLYTEKIPIEKRTILKFFYAISFIFLLLTPFRLFLESVAPKFDYFNYFGVGGFAYSFFTFFFFFVTMFSLFVLFSASKKYPKVKANQIKYLFWASLIGYFGGGGNFALVHNINLYPLTPYGTYGVVIYSFLTTYAIVKHQLMDINVVIRRTLVYSSLIALITIIYLLVVLLTERVFSYIFGYTAIPMTIAAATVIALLFIPLKDRIQHIVDRVFFKGTLDSLAKEKELMQEELIRAERLKAVSTLAAGMAHEIKNPLTAIKTFTEYLREKKDDPEFIDKFERIVGSEVDKINNIVHQLLDFARPAPLKLELANINNILDDTLSLLSNDIIRHKIRLIKEYSSLPDTPVDPNQLKQAFLNLLLNAIEAMPDGRELTVGTVPVQTKITSQGTVPKIQVIIKDTGAGIPQKDLSHIFDPFFSTKDKGTGLGLSITYEIIKKHNGKIGVESAVGKGTEIKIEL